MWLQEKILHKSFPRQNKIQFSKKLFFSLEFFLFFLSFFTTTELNHVFMFFYFCLYISKIVSTQNYKNFALAHRAKRLFTQWDHKHYWKYIFFWIGAFPSQQQKKHTELLLLLAFALVIIHIEIYIYKYLLLLLFVGSLYIYFIWYFCCSVQIQFHFR